jgi:superfamily II DNA or RNA helicase
MENGLNELIRQAEAKLSQEEERLLHAEDAESNPVIERISRIQLCQRMIRNIRMNMLVEDKSGLQMRFNQIRAVSELIRFLEQEGGDDFKGRFKQPTGAGKTVLFGVITKLIGVKTLVLVPRQNLLSNTRKEFVEMVGIPEFEIGLVGAGSSDIGKQITIATYQSHMSRMKRDTVYRRAVQQCDLIVCDEAHRALGDATKTSIESIDEGTEAEESVEEGDVALPEPEAPTIQTVEEEEEITAEEEIFEEDVLRDLERTTNRQSLKLAFTATPTLANKDVADHFPYLIAEEKQGDLVKAGILVPYKVIQVHASCETDDFEGYLSEEEEADVLGRENIYGKLTRAYTDALRRYQAKQFEADYPLHGVAFCVNIAECDKFAAEAEACGLRTRIVTSREAKGRKGDAVIAEAEEALVQQQIDLIITVNKLGEGWNFKPANAAIWARASTSPMIVIQGVGRTCRTHTDENGRTKPHSLVFETQWSLRGTYDRRRPDNRMHKKPLTIAQALALNGEDPTQVCSMENGSPLHIEKFETLKDDGTATVEGVEYVDVQRYIGQKMPQLTDYAIATLLSFNKHIKPTRPPYPVVLRGRIITCYLKSEIDKMLEESIYVPPSGIVNVTVKGEDEDAIRQIEAVYARLYLEGKVANQKMWLEQAKKLGLERIEGVTAYYRPEGRKVKTLQVDLHERKAVDDMLGNLQIAGAAGEVRFEEPIETVGEGTEIETTEGQTRTAIHLRHSSVVPKGLYEEVVRRVEEKEIQPVPKTIIGSNGRVVVMYWKDEIETVVQEIRDEKEQKRKQAEQEKIDARQREIDAMAAAAAKQREFVQSNTVKEVTPLDTAGLFFVRYRLVVNRGKNIIEGEGNAVQIEQYVSPELGRKLTPKEQEAVRRGLRSLPTMPYYWQKEVDERIRSL